MTFKTMLNGRHKVVAKIATLPRLPYRAAAAAACMTVCNVVHKQLKHFIKQVHKVLQKMSQSDHFQSSNVITTLEV